MATVTDSRPADRPEVRETFSFSLTVCDFDEKDLERIADDLYEHGCDDAIVGFHAGSPFVTFDREASSFREAVLSAVSDVQKAGLEVIRVRPPEEDHIEELNAMLAFRRQLKRTLEGCLTESQLARLLETIDAAMESNAIAHLRSLLGNGDEANQS